MMRLLLAGVLAVGFAAGALAQTGATCSANAYALCSHALCTCLDASGEETACPTDGAPQAGVVWSSCSCPVVSVGDNVQYNANYGENACEKRVPTSLPPFSTPLDDAASSMLIFSQYSLGDAIANDRYGTLSGATMQVCPAAASDGSTAHFANCLDQPCYWDGVSGEAICYCPVNAATSQWNTFTEDCSKPICDTAPNQVWSAAGVGITQMATGQLQSFIANTGRDATSVNYCPAQ